MFKKSPRGFTLIELLVVIAIIGILSSVVLASLNDARQKSRDAKRVADVKQLQLALELFYDSNGSYPTTTDLSTRLQPDYISVVPSDPVTGADYNYAYNATPATEYHLGATLEQTNHSALNADADFNSTGWTGAFDGNAATLYDVRP